MAVVRRSRTSTPSIWKKIDLEEIESFVIKTNGRGDRSVAYVLGFTVKSENKEGSNKNGWLMDRRGNLLTFSNRHSAELLCDLINEKATSRHWKH